MDLKGMGVLLPVVFLWMVALANGLIQITFGFPECTGEAMSVRDQHDGQIQYINSSCSCAVNATSVHSISLIFSSVECTTKIDLQNNNRSFIANLCNNTKYASATVTKDSKLLLIFKNADSSKVQSIGSVQNKIKIYLDRRTIPLGSNRRDLFAVTCNSTFGDFQTSSTSTTHNNADGLPTIFTTIKNVFNVTKGMADHNVNTLMTEFPYMYVVAAGGCVVVVVTLIVVFSCILRRKNSARNAIKEDTMETRAQNNSSIGVEHPCNLHPNEQHLPDNPLYQEYQENDDGGYSTCGNENQNLTEQLLDNPFYHSYQVNDDKEDAKSEKDMLVSLPIQGEIISNRNNSDNVGDSNAVYAQPNKIAKVSNTNQDVFIEDPMESVYAQVSKPKKP